MSQNIDIERRLAAVLAADVAGFSRLTEADEVGTMRLLAAQRAILDSAIAQHRGRIANTAGDSVLAEFPSVVNAVQCAVEAQQALRDAAEAVEPAERRVLFRIGIHVGDVMVRGGDLLGTGVNVAARLEALAEPGGIVLSAAAHEQVKKILPLAYTDLGAQSVKNIEEPVRAFAIGASAGAVAAAPPGDAKVLPLPDKPSIAVLPFQNMSGDPEQEYFADGMVEDIITALSRFKSLFVIARNSSFTYKRKVVDINQVGRELGVRYVLEGSVRKAGGRVRITGQLIEAATGAHLWADKIDGALEDVFALQDNVTQQVVGQIAPDIELAEFERVRRVPSDNMQAYDLYLRGRAIEFDAGRENFEQALAIYYRVIELDPRFAAAYASAASCYASRKTNGWMLDVEKETAETKRLADAAVRLGRDDAASLALCVLAYAFVLRQVQYADTLIDKALELNPNLGFAWQRRGFIHVFMGRHQEAIAAIEKAVRLSPRDPMAARASGVKAYALTCQHRFGEARTVATETYRIAPQWSLMPGLLAVISVNEGELEEARRWAAAYAAAHPTLRVSNLRGFLPTQRPEDTELLIDGLRRAGFPE